MEENSLENHFSIENIDQIFLDRIKNKAGKGIDGNDSDTFYESFAITSEGIKTKALNGKYRFSPYLEIIKSKGRGKKPRIISKPTIRDKLTLSIVKDILHERYSESIQNQLPNTYIKQIKDIINAEDQGLCFLKIDVKGFYDNIDHGILINHCLKGVGDDRVIKLIRRAIKNKTVPKNYRKFESLEYCNEVGVPQGLSISNVLAGIYMKEFDASFSSYGRLYVRYVDDILLFLNESELPVVENEIVASLYDIGLETNDKTERGRISKSFDYLGYRISDKNISVRDSTVERYIFSVIAMFTDFKHNASHRSKNIKWMNDERVKELFILKLNEKITGAVTDKKRYGWVFYFIEITDMQLLHKIDSIIKLQFSKLSLFNREAPDELKTLVRSHYCAKHEPLGGYIHNYSSYESISEKVEFLVKFGYIAEYDSKNYTENEIERRFEKIKSSHLVKLEEDVGSIS
jgi:RNA-directed DNA polymerase